MKQTTHATYYDDNRKNRKTMREEDERIFSVAMLFDDNTKRDDETKMSKVC